MAIHQNDGRVRLEGQVTVEDAEALMQALRAVARPVVDLEDCAHLHAAALQVLLALRPALSRSPTDAALRAALGGLALEASQP